MVLVSKPCKQLQYIKKYYNFLCTKDSCIIFETEQLYDCQHIATVTQLIANRYFKQSTTYPTSLWGAKQEALRAYTGGFIRHFWVHIIVQKHPDSSTVLAYWNAIQAGISLLDSTLATPHVRDLLMWPTVKPPEQFPCSSPHYFSLMLKGIHSLFKQWSGKFNEFSE